MAYFMASKNDTICKKIFETTFCFLNLCVVGYESVIEKREMITQLRKNSINIKVNDFILLILKIKINL